jgi:general secretion pathway protein A
MDPFGVSPDPRFWVATPQHVEASAALYYAIAQRRGFAVLIAPPGLGKTTVLTKLSERIRGESKIALLVHPGVEMGSVLESVLLAMGLNNNPAPDAVSCHEQLHQFLLDLNRQNKTCVVIFDEAQNLSFHSLESIRMLSNYETTSHKLIQFVLAGQPTLADVLMAQECQQIRQRINTVARLEPLSPEQTGEYIAARLRIAGAKESPFEPLAIEAIALHSGGIPRNINTLCFNALTYAFAKGKSKVDGLDVNEACDGLMLRSDAAAPASEPVLTPRSRSHSRRLHQLLWAACLGCASSIAIDTVSIFLR